MKLDQFVRFLEGADGWRTSVEPTRNHVVRDPGTAPFIFLCQIDQAFVELVQSFQIIALGVGGPMSAGMTELIEKSQHENHERARHQEPAAMRGMEFARFWCCSGHGCHNKQGCWPSHNAADYRRFGDVEGQHDNRAQQCSEQKSKLEQELFIASRRRFSENVFP